MCTRYYIELNSNKLYAMVNGVLYEYALSSCTHCIIDPLAERTCTTRTIIWVSAWRISLHAWCISLHACASLYTLGASLYTLGASLYTRAHLSTRLAHLSTHACASLYTLGASLYTPGHSYRIPIHYSTKSSLLNEYLVQTPLKCLLSPPLKELNLQAFFCINWRTKRIVRIPR